MLRLGDLQLKSNIILAPMAGISDLPFRIINREHGCELAFTEMINVRSLGYKSRKTRHMLSSGQEDRPLAVQILGCEPRYIRRGLDILKDYEFDLLDFNAACPVRKVVRRGEGASLLKEPKKLNKVLKLIIKNSNSSVTVKIRSCWDGSYPDSKEISRAAEDAGVAAIFVHGRTKEQGYSGAVDYKAIARAKKSVSIPVIGSGNIFSPILAKKMLDETGCDGVLIARGGLGNPWLFRELSEFLRSGNILQRPDKRQILDVMRRHFMMCIDFHEEKNAVIIFRKFFSWYTKGFRKIRPLREKISYAKTPSEVFALIDLVDEGASLMRPCVMQIC